MRDKKAALELSMSTIVILVLAMAMLILGLILVRNIFFNATKSVDDLGEKVQNEIANLFVDENEYIIIKLGGDQTAKIKQDTKDFGIAFGARTQDGGGVDRTAFKYKLALDTESIGNCVDKSGLNEVEGFFNQRMGSLLTFPKTAGEFAFARVSVDIPDGTPLCSQMVYVETFEDGESTSYSDFFNIQIIRKGLF